MVDVMGGAYNTINTQKEEESYDKDKFTQLKRLICESIKGILQKLGHLKLQIQTITSADQMVAKKPICSCIIDVSKVLADYPLGQGYEPSKFPPGCAYQPKLIAFHTNMDLLIWENCSKISIIEDYVLNAMNPAKVITVGVTVRAVQKILKTIPASVFDSIQGDHFGADDVILVDSHAPDSPAISYRPPSPTSNIPLESKFASTAIKDPHVPAVKESRPSPNSPKVSSLNLPKSEGHSPQISPRRLFDRFSSSSRSKSLSPRADIKQANVVLRSGILTVRGTKSKFLQEMADVDSTVEKKMPTVRQSQSELVSEILAENSEDVSWDPQQLRGRLSALRKKGRRDSDTSSIAPSIPEIFEQASFATRRSASTGGESLLSLFVPPSTSLEMRRHAQLDDTNNPLVAKVKGYQIDLGQAYITQPPLPHELRIMDTDLDIPHYTTDFFPNDHYNFIGMEKSSSPRHALVSVLIRKVAGHSSKSSFEFKVLIKTTDRDDLHSFSTTSSSESINSKKALRIVKKNLTKLSNYSLEEVDSVPFRVQLKDFECRQLRGQYRMGVLYCKDGQTNEDDMYSNVDPSPYFVEFLEILGSTIELEGWAKFKGGLDVKGGSTGQQSVFTNFGPYDIMFHVSTMLPFQQDDVQRVERKRHIGNDVVVVVFVDTTAGQPLLTKFDPSVVRSQFNHVFVVVHVDHSFVPLPGQENVTHYNIAITYKEGVPAFGPVYPRNFSFSKDKFREFLLTKLINGERAALHAPIFAQKIKRTRREAIKLLYDSNRGSC